MAYLLLDENLATIDQQTMDPAQKILVKLAEEFGRHYPEPLKDAAALGFLLAGSPEDQRHDELDKKRTVR